VRQWESEEQRSSCHYCWRNSFLVRQNISFCGHDKRHDSVNRDNFLEMVHFTARYNPVIKNWLESHPGNVTWLSHDVQNELLHLLADEVVSRIANTLFVKPFRTRQNAPFCKKSKIFLGRDHSPFPPPPSWPLATRPGPPALKTQRRPWYPWVIVWLVPAWSVVWLCALGSFTVPVTSWIRQGVGETFARMMSQTGISSRYRMHCSGGYQARFGQGLGDENRKPIIWQKSSGQGA